MKYKQQEQKLSGFRKWVFPIHSHELKKVVPLLFLMFLVAYTYSTLRTLKDAYIMGLSGVDLLTKVKLYGVIPFMFFFKFAYDAMAKRASYHKRMYIMLGFYVVCFVTFYLHRKFDRTYVTKDLEGKGNWEQIKCIWPELLFYILAESYGSFVLSVGLWAFVIRITTAEQTKRVYTTLSLGAGIATIVAGTITVVQARTSTKTAPDVLIFFVLGAILATGITYFFFTKKMDADPKAYEVPEITKKPKKKKLPFIASIKAFWRSENFAYIGCLAFIVFIYNASIGFFELMSKNLIGLFGEKYVQEGIKVSKAQFTSEMYGWQLVGVGIASVLFVLFLSSPIVKRGWRFTALTTPLILLFGSLIFFGCLHVLGYEEILKSNYVWVLYVGVLVIILGKSVKYVFFDTCNQRAFHALDEEARLTGKSFVDGVAGRLGKGGAAFYAQGILGPVIQYLYPQTGKKIPFLTLSSVTGVILTASIVFWVFVVIKLNRLYQKQLTKNEQSMQSAGNDDEKAAK